MVVSAPTLGVVRTALVTTGCGLAGTVAEGRSLPGGLIAFSSQCLLSNLGMVPSASAVDDLAWSTVLPMSLAMAVLGSVLQSADTRASLAKGTYRSIFTAFVLAAIASLVGALCSFFVVLRPGLPPIARIEPVVAAQAAGAVAATYIGGSANFAEVGRRLGLPPETFGSIAAADIALMAVYFAGMTAAVRSRRLARWVAGSRSKEAAASAGHSAPAPAVARWRGAQAAVACTVAALSVAAGSRMDVFPGAQTLATVAWTTAAAWALRRLLGPDATAGFGRAARALAPALLNVFYAAVGATARAERIVSCGMGSVVLVATALGTHVALILCFTWLINRLSGLVDITLTEAMVASNAAVGGPSTAAAFAGMVAPSLVVPAALTGVLGYGVGTAVGLRLHGVLAAFALS